jgi:hypothetical protein
MENANLSAAQFRVLGCLCSYLNVRRKDAISWPSIATIAGKCGFTEKTVKRALKALQELGIIEHLGKPFAGSVRYAIRPPIGTPEPLLDDSNRDATTLIKEASIGTFQSANQGSHVPPIGTPRPQEVTQRTNNNRNVPKRIEFPPGLSGDAFKAAWSEWEQHRKEIRKPLTPTSSHKQLTKLAAMGETQAIEAINQSIENGWQGIFPPKASADAVHQPKRAADLRI